MIIKTHKIKIYILSISTIILITSCNGNCCDHFAPDLLPENVLRNYETAPKNYCCIAYKAYNGEQESILKLSLLYFDNSFIGEHGIFLLHLIEKIGEDDYISSISKINENEKRLISTYLSAGLQMIGNKDELNNIYPKVATFLNSH